MQTMVKVYTDGSCIASNHDQETIGAWVAIIFLDNEKIVLKHVVRNTTHNRMELLAVIHAIEFVISKSIIVKSFTIYSDSQYVVQLEDRKEKLKSNNFLTNKGTPIQNKDLIKTLIHQIETHQIKFVKVKAHLNSGDAPNYNREADILSRKLAREQLAGLKGKRTLLIAK